ncbi:MAG: hypothetical protein Q9160_008211 [Pyrenula sp. 1 TL-2023]
MAVDVAPHILDALIDRNRHKIIILSRKVSKGASIAQSVLSSSPIVSKPQSAPLAPGITQYRCVDYCNLQQLTGALTTVDVVLSFILPFADKGNTAQKTLIDACIQAGVRRFAPSEWAVASSSSNPYYQMRDDVRKYLEEVNSPTQRLEYTCFQPGLFLDYFTYPMQSAKHLKITQHYIDFYTRQAILVGNGDQPVTFTLIDDLAEVVAEAVDYQGTWPAAGGVAGWQTTSAELARLGAQLRGEEKFTIHRVSKRDLDSGKFLSEWCPILAHPSIPEEQLEPMSRSINLEAMKGVANGEWVVGEEWNKLLPHYQFADPAQFLAKWWLDREPAGNRDLMIN